MAGLSLLAGASILLLTGCSSGDAEDKLRFGWPTGVTKQAERMRVLWTWSTVAALVIGVLVWGLIFWVCGRYRQRTDDIPRQTKYNLPLEIVYTIVPLMIVAGLFYFTVRTENYVDKRTKNPDVVVQVDAFKWNWQFIYKTHHGTPTNYAGASGSVSTVGTSDEIPVLVLPQGETVRIVEHSQDVIHSFWVPEFLFKRDVIPYDTDDTSRDNQFEFTATANGSFVGRCAELCGAYHSQMNFEVRVVDPTVFDAYVAKLSSLGPNDSSRQSEALQSLGQSPVATTTKPFDTDPTRRSATQ
ncbi:MAG: cytochrome c oxidase subunit II [Actinomycetota bacterium]